MTKTVLFLCTGNYYRSRYAESYFNALAARRGLAWEAASRGFQPSPEYMGAMARDALIRLRLQGIAPGEPVRAPLALQEEDLAAADCIVALNEVEHRPMVEAAYPGWAGKVRYWSVHDVDVTAADAALAAIEEMVMQLLRELSEL